MTAQQKQTPLVQQGKTQQVQQPASPASPGGPVSQPGGQPHIPPAPQMPISTPHKEFAPVAQPQEFIKPSQPEVPVSPELQEHGVEQSKDTEQVQLSAEQKKAGIEAAKEATPLQTEPSGVVQLPPLPISQDAAVQVKKTRPVADSIRWLAELVLEQVKRAHQQIRKN